MKSFTHPSLSYIYIRHKDGSSYGKYWGYLRSTLLLEVGSDSKKWESSNLINKRKVFSFAAFAVVNEVNPNTTVGAEPKTEISTQMQDCNSNNKWSVSKLANSSFWLNN